jgi:hypothetical protein
MFLGLASSVSDTGSRSRMTVTIRGISEIRKFVIFPVSKPLALNAKDSTIRLGDNSLSSAVVLVTIHYELPYQRITKSNA